MHKFYPIEMFSQGKETLLKPHFHLKISIKILQITGTWLPEKSGFTRNVYCVYGVLYFLFTLGIHIFVEFVNLLINYNDVNKIASGGPLFITNCIHALKVLTIIRYHRRIRKLLSVMESPIFSKDNLRYEKLVSSYAWQGIFHHSMFQICGTFACLLWTCIPIQGFVSRNEKKLPLDGWYPYDVNDNFAFILTWAHQGVSIIFCCFNDLATDAFITGLINVASCQYEILKCNFVSLGSNVEERNLETNLKENDEKNCTDDRIIACVKHNLAIFEFVNEIQNMFSTVIGLQLFVNCFILCLTTFYISQSYLHFNLVEIIGNCAYTMCMTYQIFIYTWQGNELYLQSETLSSAIYMSNWWKFHSRFRRNLHIIMLRTQKPLIVTTKLLITLTVPTFMTIIRMSYSMFTLLRRKNA